MYIYIYNKHNIYYVYVSSKTLYIYIYIYIYVLIEGKSLQCLKSFSLQMRPLSRTYLFSDEKSEYHLLRMLP